MKTVKPDFNRFDGTRILHPDLALCGRLDNADLLVETMTSKWVFYITHGKDWRILN